MNLASGLGGLLASHDAPNPANAATIIKGVAGVVTYPTMFLVGRWVGRRGTSNGLVTIFIIAALARGVTSLVDVSVMAPDELAAMIGMGLWELILLGTVLLFATGCLGYWRGTRQRLGAYLTYLLRHVSSDTREAIVELAFAEAAREMPGRRKHSGPIEKPEATPAGTSKSD
jgi:hypothetical protein